ncbi:MAG: hypothetical protein ACYDBY_15230 [Thermoanaerobaculia bacterium]
MTNETPLPIEAGKDMPPGATVKADLLALVVTRVDALAERCGGQSRFAMANALLLAGLMVAESVATPMRKS